MANRRRRRGGIDGGGRRPFSTRRNGGAMAASAVSRPSAGVFGDITSDKKFAAHVSRGSLSWHQRNGVMPSRHNVGGCGVGMAASKRHQWLA